MASLSHSNASYRTYALTSQGGHFGGQTMKHPLRVRSMDKRMYPTGTQISLLAFILVLVVMIRAYFGLCL